MTISAILSRPETALGAGAFFVATNTSHRDEIVPLIEIVVVLTIGSAVAHIGVNNFATPRTQGFTFRFRFSAHERLLSVVGRHWYYRNRFGLVGLEPVDLLVLGYIKPSQSLHRRHPSVTNLAGLPLHQVLPSVSILDHP